MPAERVSIVMPMYNSAAFVRRSIDSVLRQTYADFELLIVDDRSTDDSAEIVAGYAEDDSRIRLIRQQRNGGVAAARNAAIAAASGKYIAFLDSDDWWHPKKLELQVATMRDRRALISYSAYQRVAEDGKLLSLVTPPSEIGYRTMLRSNHLGNLTGMYDRALGDQWFRKIGHEDYVFWLSLIKKAKQGVRVDHSEPLAYYLVRNQSLSANKLRAARWQWQIYRTVEQIPAPQAACLMGHYVWQALSKRR